MSKLKTYSFSYRDEWMIEIKAKSEEAAVNYLTGQSGAGKVQIIQIEPLDNLWPEYLHRIEDED